MKRGGGETRAENGPIAPPPQPNFEAFPVLTVKGGVKRKELKQTKLNSTPLTPGRGAQNSPSTNLNPTTFRCNVCEKRS